MELEEEKYTERREKVYTFMKIPREFEKVNKYYLFCWFLPYTLPNNFLTFLQFLELCPSMSSFYKI